RDALLARALDEAVQELSGRQGPDPEKWIWGASHHALIRHPLATVSPGLAAQYDVGNLPRSGDASTVDATGGGANQTAGGSFKIIADPGDWDASIGINNPANRAMCAARITATCIRSGLLASTFLSSTPGQKWNPWLSNGSRSSRGRRIS